MRSSAASSPLLLGGKRGQQSPLVVEMFGGDAVDDVAALRGQLHEYDAPIVATGDALDEPLVLQAVQTVGDCARRDVLRVIGRRVGEHPEFRSALLAYIEWGHDLLAQTPRPTPNRH